MRVRLSGLAVLAVIVIVSAACATSALAAAVSTALPATEPPAAATLPPTPAAAPPAVAPPPPTPLSLASPAPGMSEVEKQVRTFVDAANHGDSDTALSVLVDDGLSYMSSGFTTYEFTAHDKATVRRGILEYIAGLGGVMEISDCAPKGTGLGCSILARDDYRYKARCGLDVVPMQLTVKQKDGKIQFMSFQPALSTDQACGKADSKFVSWAEANRAGEWNKIKSAVAYDLAGRPLGEAESALYKAYLESQK